MKQSKRKYINKDVRRKAVLHAHDIAIYYNATLHLPELLKINVYDKNRLLLFVRIVDNYCNFYYLSTSRITILYRRLNNFE